MEEERGEQVAGAVDRDRQLWRPHAPEPGLVGGEDVERVRGRVVERERSDGDDLGAARDERGDRRARLRQGARRGAGQPFELECVRGRDRGGGQRPVAEEVGDPRAT